MKREIILHGTAVPYTLIRSMRKTIGLKVNAQGLTLRVPLYCTNEAIKQALLRHATWITGKLAQVPQPQILQAGQHIVWLGKTMPLIANAPYSQVSDNACHLAAADDDAALRTALARLYRQMALPYLQTRVAYWAGTMQLIPHKVHLSNAQKRWGSCNYRKEIRLSWRLLQVPPDCIDYVIIHELAHLQEMNHSSRFWDIVRQYCPTYQHLRKQLRQVSLFF